jgi:sodium/bile acid cotransporter 7
MWETFSSCFYYQALENITHQSVILVCFLNVGLYIFFTLFSLFISRPPIHPTSRFWQRIFYRFPKPDTVAICFCAPAKSVSIGAPLIGVLWSVGFSDQVQSLVMVPIVLYQAEQILCGQIAVMLFRRWIRDEIPESLPADEETATETSSHTAVPEDVLDVVPEETIQKERK